MTDSTTLDLTRDIDTTRTDNRQPPLSPSDLPCPAEKLVTCAECLLVCRDGTTHPLPGLADSALLADASPVVSLACDHLTDCRAVASFLWPVGDPSCPDEHVRVTVLASPPGSPAGLFGAVVLSAAADLHGLTPRELQVLGLVVEGLSNQQIARQLVVAPRTVATHMEHILLKLGASTRTLAAVRAERRGLYVPKASMPST